MSAAFNDLVGLALLGLGLWAIYNVLRSAATAVVKTLWVLLIALLPVLGVIIWAIAGPRCRAGARGAGSTKSATGS